MYSHIIKAIDVAVEDTVVQHKPASQSSLVVHEDKMPAKEVVVESDCVILSQDAMTAKELMRITRKIDLFIFNYKIIKEIILLKPYIIYIYS